MTTKEIGWGFVGGLAIAAVVLFGSWILTIELNEVMKVLFPR